MTTQEAIKKEKLTGHITMEDDNNLEIEFNDATSHHKLLLFPKKAYFHLKTGDIVRIHLEKLN